MKDKCWNLTNWYHTYIYSGYGARETFKINVVIVIAAIKYMGFIFKKKITSNFYFQKHNNILIQWLEESI